MSKYLVVFTIYNDSDNKKRERFTSGLENLGLNKYNDQSTHYGSHSGTHIQLLDKIRILAKELNDDDTVTFFYAQRISPKNYSIIEVKIK